jgi:ribosomal protein S14
MEKKRNQKDFYRRVNYNTKEIRLYLLKSIFYNRYLNSYIRLKSSIILEKLNGGSTKIKNRCILTGRGRGVLRDFKVFRMNFKELASKGLLPGVRKSSW